MKIALQLYSIREMAKNEGLEALLKAASKAGYDGVEFAGYYDKTPKEVKELLKKYNLLPAGSHLGYDAFCADSQKMLDSIKEIGLYSAVVPGVNFDSVEGWKTFCENMNSFGKLLADNGVKFGYHNHSHEFNKLGDKYIIDYILENTCKNCVNFEMDTHWVVRGNEDPCAYAKKYADRMPIFHAKDIDDNNEDTEVGCGRIDYKTIIKNINKLDWIVVEQEAFKIDMADSIRISCENLNKLIK